MVGRRRHLAPPDHAGRDLRTLYLAGGCLWRKGLSVWPPQNQWGSRYLVGGRKTTPAGPKTSLCRLVDDQLHEFAELPSGGDASYPGFVEMSQDRALVSYYSSHERDDLGKPITAIYVAELVLSQ